MLLYDPTAPQPPAPHAQERRLATLSGKRIGFIDNAKPNFDHLVEALAARLIERHAAAGIVRRRKSSASIPAPEEMVIELAAQCDLVITGSGD